MIEIKNVVAGYGDTIILNGVSLEIEDNETMVIMGQSGCGKSTLLKLLIGLLRPFDGEILVDGKDIAKAREKEHVAYCRSFGVLFQGSALFNSMSVEDNVTFPLREHQPNLADSTMRIMARMKLELVGLAGCEELLPSQLSGGMKKRAALARAMVMDPKLLFLDEPSAGLDPVIAAGLDDLINKVKKAFKMSMVVVTHDIESSFRIADRMTVFRDGQVLQIGTPDDIRDSKDDYVQQFIHREPDEEAVPEGYVERLTRT